MVDRRSRSVLIATLRTILHGASVTESKVNATLHNKSRTDPEDQGGDGVPQPGHRGTAISLNKSILKIFLC